jgi:hypothetical protein
MSMYRKYLLKRNFWAVTRKNGLNNCYVKHDISVGGIYAYVLERSVKIVANSESRTFSNFDELDVYLDRLALPNHIENNNFTSVLNRRNNERLLRKIPI